MSPIPDARPPSGFPRERASGGENGVSQQLSFDDLLTEAAETSDAPRRLLTPAEVAARCGLSYAPSPEQARVVEAPADRPLVVVAGAGSGKTETMAARVSWLVANQIVAPEEILGLTFTRKAASELNERVHLRLGALARHPDTEPELRERLSVAQPTVSTYHGYAAALVAEHGLRIGVEPGAGVLGPAMCWGQAATAVAGHTGDMSDVALGLVTTTEDVLQLAAELGEHDITPAALRAWTARFKAQLTGYPDAGRKKGPYAEVRDDPRRRDSSGAPPWAYRPTRALRSRWEWCRLLRPTGQLSGRQRQRPHEAEERPLILHFQVAHHEAV